MATALLFAGSALAAQKPGNDQCLACHDDASLTTQVNGSSLSLYVNPARFKNSIHGKLFSCVDCHTDVKSSPHETTPAKISCANCHAGEQAAYQASSHAKAREAGNFHAATCVDCHGGAHDLLPASDPASKINHSNIPRTCGMCHGQKFVMQMTGHSTQPYLSYEESVHGRAVSAGSQRAAVCTDCHGSHEILGAANPKSSIFKFNVPGTCGKCHGTVAQEFRQSIHGQVVARGNWQAPVCTDCHGIHSIQARTEANSPVAVQNLAAMTCGRCHESVRLSQEFGFEGGRATTYFASYHGLASRRGSKVVANCASCHGVHNILPSSDPRSTIHRANLVKTCGQCHPGVTEQFVSAKVHLDAPLSADTGSIAVRWIRKIYLALIAVVIGGMLAHNLVIWGAKAIQRRQAQRQAVVRMTRDQRWQHAALFISFFVLALTGFALKFPNSWFAALLGMSESVRRIVHRAAGCILITAGIYHICYLALRAEGRTLFWDLLPAGKDLSDAWTNLRHYLGRASAKPPFGRFNYAEKAEYWALVWGVVVMGITGVMLWAKIFVGSLLPRWWLDVATAVHFYEAVLATLAILVWHFYQVFFDPDVYPMNWAWWDGEVPLEHYRAEHPLDLDAVLEAGHAGRSGEVELQGADPDKSSVRPELAKKSENEKSAERTNEP